MPCYTLNIKDRPVLVFYAENAERALEIADSDALADDLLLYYHNGNPLWNGQDAFVVNDASEIDAASWNVAFASALREGGADLVDKPAFIIFLIPVTNDPLGPCKDSIFPDNRH